MVVVWWLGQIYCNRICDGFGPPSVFLNKLSFDGSVIICGPWDLMMICQSLNMSNVYTKSEFGWMALGSETVL